MSTENKCPYCERYYNTWHGSKPYCPTCDSEIGQMKRALEASQARVREQQADKELLASQNITLHRQRDQAEARVAVLRERMGKAEQALAPDARGCRSRGAIDAALDVLITLDPNHQVDAAAERLLEERKLLRKLSESFASVVTEDSVRETLLCYVMGAEALATLTALHEFDDKETK